MIGGEACGGRVHASLFWSELCGEACASSSLGEATWFGQGRACLVGEFGGTISVGRRDSIEQVQTFGRSSLFF